MKNLLKNTSIIVLILLSSCNNSNYNLLKSLSSDSLFISKNLNWQNPSSDMKEIYSDSITIIGYTTTELLKLEGDQIILIRTSVMKTSDDSIHLFWPPEDGGTICIGRILDNSILESNTISLNKKQIKLTDNKLIDFNDKLFEKIYKTNFNWFREVMDKYSYSKSNDSLTIILSGP